MDKASVKSSISHLKPRHFEAIVYLTVLFAVVSLYLKTGYLHIDEDKYRVYRDISLVGIPAWWLLRVIDFIYYREWKKIKERAWSGDATVIFIGMYILAALISMLSSPYRLQAIYGSTGWYMGFIMHLSMICIYIIVRDLIRENDRIIAVLFVGMLLAVAGIVFVLAVLNRFSIFPFAIQGKEEEFISTLGNVNWFTGYWCIFCGIGFGLFLKARTDAGILLGGVYVWICAMAGMCCGSDSAYLGLLIILMVSFLMALGDAAVLRMWAIMAELVLFTLPCIRYIGVLRPYRLWYGSLLLKTAYGNIWIIPFVLGTLICMLITWNAGRLSGAAAGIRSLVIGAAVAAGAAGLTVFVLNNVISGGIWPVRGISFFTFTEDWGNSRGLIWKATWLMIRDTQPIYMVFGIGCDCYGSHAYAIDSSALLLRSRLGDMSVTNAHNEILTMLINEGIFGVVAYVGVFVSHFRASSGYWKENGCVWGIILGAAGYITVGMTGFMNILSTPFIFMVLGVMAGLTNRRSLNTIIEV